MAWSCTACTFANSNGNASSCEICETPRPQQLELSLSSSSPQPLPGSSLRTSSNNARKDAMSASSTNVQRLDDAPTPKRKNKSTVQQTLFGRKAVAQSNNPEPTGATTRKKSRRDPTSNTESSQATRDSSNVTTQQATSVRSNAVNDPHSSSRKNRPATTTTAATTTTKQLTITNTALSWSELKVRAQRILQETFQITSFRSLQRVSIKCALQRQSQTIVMATGGGKSLCYQLPAVTLQGTTIVISPLISLMVDQVQALNRKNITAAALYSSNGERNNLLVLERLVGRRLRPPPSSRKSAKDEPQQQQQPDTALLYCTPEQVASTKFRNVLHELHNQRRLTMIAIDEAHCLSTWGHDFRPAYRQLGWLRQTFPTVPCLACTATATPHVLKDIRQILQLEDCPCHVGSFDRENIFYRVTYVDALNDMSSVSNSNPSVSGAHGASTSLAMKHLVKHLTKLHHQLEQQSLPCSGIIYCHKRTDTEDLARYLNQHTNIRVVAYHGGLNASQRSDAQDKWTSGYYQVVTATTAFGMGIDLEHVRYVVHWSMSQSVEAFYQESGRAGRDGKPSHSLLYVSQQDVRTLRYVVSQQQQQRSKNNEQHSARKLEALELMVKYATTAHCRRKYLLQHFGAEHDATKSCNGKCDYCSNPGKVERTLEEALTAREAYNRFSVQSSTPFDGESSRHRDIDEEDDDDMEKVAQVGDLGIACSVVSEVEIDAEASKPQQPRRRDVSATLAKYEAIELQHSQKTGFVHFRKTGTGTKGKVTMPRNAVKVPEHLRSLAPKLSVPTMAQPAKDEKSSEYYASRAAELRAELERLRASQNSAVRKGDDVTS